MVPASSLDEVATVDVADVEVQLAKVARNAGMREV